MLTKEQEKQVKDILLMEIEKPSRGKFNIYIKNQKIHTTQIYRGSLDPDMSDIAVEFYKVIYEDVLDEECKDILNKSLLINKDFCGDTMNSYNRISKNLTSDLKKKLNGQYHCLANFWLLPMHVGHGSPYTSKLGLSYYSKSTFSDQIYDYMDRFINKFFIEINEYKRVYPNYTHIFTKNNFATKHFIDDIYIKNGKVLYFSNNDNADEVANIMIDKINKRADKLVKEKGPQLYKLFAEDLKLITKK